ncbi:MAG: outer membrane beta-barrel protein [Bauldia sp.]
MKFLAHGSIAAVALSAMLAAGSAGAAPVAANWTGFYVGAVGSYGGGNSTAAFTAPTSSPDITSWKALDVPANGGLLGITVGYNFAAMNNMVFGIEGDASWGRIGGHAFMDSSSVPYNPNPTDGWMTQTYFATLRARLGWTSTLMSNPTLFYLTAGVATTDGFREITNRTVGYSDARATHTGGVFGGGVESKITDTWSWKAELLFADLGTQSYQHSYSPVVTAVHLTDTLFRFGINKHF